MEFEVDLNKEGVVSLIGNGDLGIALKPLQKEIYLFDTFIAGTTHLKKPKVLDEIREGDSLLLQREDNPYDDNAILILTKDKRKLGYVPRKHNAVFARLMDAGKILKASITEFQEETYGFRRICVRIFLVDY